MFRRHPGSTDRRAFGNTLMIKTTFYDSFACIAGDCRHTCCKGWEIDIDPDTAEYYEDLSGDMGDEIRNSIFYDEEGCHFSLKDEACPFLAADGLCRVIRELGEESLCDICALHPRFFLEVGEEELAGQGLACEVACELLLAGKGDLLFTDDRTAWEGSMGELLKKSLICLNSMGELLKKSLICLKKSWEGRRRLMNYGLR